MGSDEAVREQGRTGPAPVPPGPKGRPITGSAKEFNKQRLAFFRRCIAEFGTYVPFKVGPKRAVMVAR